MRLTRTLGMAGGLILAALVGGTLIGATLATDDPSTDVDTADDSGYCDTYLDALATELGVSRDDLVAAGRAAALAAVDAAVGNGDLDDERAQELRDRIADAGGDGCGLFGHAPGFVRGFGHGLGHGLARGFLGGDAFEAAAGALGIDPSELIDEVRDAGSLQALAEDRGVAYAEVTSAVLAAVQSDLDAAVEQGLARDRADEILERITRWLDEGGEAADAPGMGLRAPEVRFHDGATGPFGPFGPWGDDHADDESDTEGPGA